MPEIPRPAIDDQNLEVARIALKNSWITQEQLDECLRISRQVSSAGLPKTLNQVLVEKNYLTQARLASILQELGRPVAEMDIYEILAKLGEGGMGTVYKVRDKTSGKFYALKLLKRELARDTEYLQRFTREMDNAFALNHPNIVGAVASGAYKGLPYFVMEYIDGDPLDKIIKKKSRLWEKEAASITSQIAAALAYANQHHVVHRDIKPANILVSRDGQAKLCDLGIAKSMDSTVSLTATGFAVGSPAFFSPEQVQGVRKLDIRSDLYSLGVTLYNMVTGRRPFDGDNPNTVAVKRLHENPVHPRTYAPEISNRMSTLILTLMARDPAQRFQTPEEVIAACEPILKELPDTAAETPTAPTVPLRPSGRRTARAVPPPPPSRNRAMKLSLAGGAVGILGILLVIIMLAKSGKAERRAQEEEQKQREARVQAEFDRLAKEAQARAAAERAKEAEDRRRAEEARQKKEEEERRIEEDRRQKELEAARAEAERAKKDAELARADADRIRREAEQKEKEEKLKKEAEAARAEAERRQKEAERMAAELARLKQEEERRAREQEAQKQQRDAAKTHFAKGEEKYQAGDHQGAIAEYDRCIAVNPNFVEAYHSRARAKDELGKYKEAIADYNKVLSLNPRNEVAFNDRGVAKFNMGEFAAAIADYTEALKVNTTYTVAFFNRGSARMRISDYVNAIQDFTRAIENQPNHGMAYEVRAHAKLRLKPPDYQGAIGDWEKAVQFNPARKGALQPLIDDMKLTLKNMKK